MGKVFTGSKGCLKLNGVKVAYVGSVTVNENNELTPVPVLDQLEVAEHAETGHDVSFSCNLFKVIENGTIALGLRTNNLRDLLTQPELTMEIYNSVDDRVEYTISGVKYSGGTGSMDARGIWNGSYNFVGRVGLGL